MKVRHTLHAKWFHDDRGPFQIKVSHDVLQMEQYVSRTRPPPLPKQRYAHKGSETASTLEQAGLVRTSSGGHGASKSANSEHLSLAELGQQTIESQEILASLGAVMSVFMRSDTTKRTTLAQMEQLVTPALQNGQCLLAYAHSKKSGMRTPIAAVLWAKVCKEVDIRLSNSLDQPAHLDPTDWKSGDVPWLIAAAGDNRFVGKLVKRLQTDVLRGEQIRFRSTAEDGSMRVSSIKPHTLKCKLHRSHRDSPI